MKSSKLEQVKLLHTLIQPYTSQRAQFILAGNSPFATSLYFVGRQLPFFDEVLFKSEQFKIGDFVK
jgi:hypothetical protein